MKKISLSSPFIVICFAINHLAVAENYSLAQPTLVSDRHITFANSVEHIDFVQVIDSQPIYETISYEKPVYNCHHERRQVRRNHSSNTAIILGSLIGGAIGNELGHHKSNKRIGAAAGAILGASIAKDMNNKHKRYYNNDGRVCITTYQVHYKQEITGYNVSYKYRGNSYSTVMDQPPGDRIKVAVTIRPLNS